MAKVNVKAGRRRRRRNRRRQNAGGTVGYQKSNRKHFASSAWSPSISLCPDRQFVTLRFSQINNFAAIGTLVTNQIFRGNHQLDPDVTSPGPGTSAYGAPQWHVFYNRCYVTSSSIRVRIIMNQKGTLEVVLFPANTSFASTNIDNAAMRARSKSVLLGGDNETKTMMGWASTKAITGENWNRAQTGNADPLAPIHPESDWFWHIALQMRSSTALPVSIQTDITYNVVYYDRRPVLGAAGSSS